VSGGEGCEGGQEEGRMDGSEEQLPVSHHIVPVLGLFLGCLSCTTGILDKRPAQRLHKPCS
jgi:hypothetical protein